MGAALSEAWLWLLLAFILGLVIGYFLKKWTVRERTTTDTITTTRIAELEAQLAECTSSAGMASTSDGTTFDTFVAAAPAASTPATLVAPVAKKAPSARKPAVKAPAAKAPAAKPAAKAPAVRKPAVKAAALDLAAGKAALGTSVKLDDLKLIEGIGPKIEALFKADGLTTWRQLSKANVERLQGILDAAGPRYNIHNPGSWPTQAGLLADGKWAEFKALTDDLKSGR